MDGAPAFSFDQLSERIANHLTWKLSPRLEKLAALTDLAEVETKLLKELEKQLNSRTIVLAPSQVDDLVHRVAGCVAQERNRLIDCKEMAERLGVSTRTVSKLMHRGDIPKPYHLGGATRWNWNDVLKHLNGRVGIRKRKHRAAAGRRRAQTGPDDELEPTETEDGHTTVNPSRKTPPPIPPAVLAIKEYLANQEPGTIEPTEDLESLLVACWPHLKGWNKDGMGADRVKGCIVGVSWHPPRIAVRVKRHVGSIPGSPEDQVEPQEWLINVLAMTVRMMPPMRDVEAVAAELATAIIARKPDLSLRWRRDGSVRALAEIAIPRGSYTMQDHILRRRRLYKLLPELLEPHGWQERWPMLFEYHPPRKSKVTTAKQ